MQGREDALLLGFQLYPSGAGIIGGVCGRRRRGGAESDAQCYCCAGEASPDGGDSPASPAGASLEELSESSGGA